MLEWRLVVLGSGCLWREGLAISDHGEEDECAVYD